MGDMDDDIHEADLRNGEPGATDWSETDAAAGSAGGDDDPVASQQPPLDDDPDPGQLPSDSDVQAERRP